MARWKFNGLHIEDNRKILRSMLKKTRLLTRPTPRAKTHRSTAKAAAREEAMA